MYLFIAFVPTVLLITLFSFLILASRRRFHSLCRELGARSQFLGGAVLRLGNHSFSIESLSTQNTHSGFGGSYLVSRSQVVANQRLRAGNIEAASILFALGLPKNARIEKGEKGDFFLHSASTPISEKNYNLLSDQMLDEWRTSRDLRSAFAILFSDSKSYLKIGPRIEISRSGFSRPWVLEYGPLPWSILAEPRLVLPYIESLNSFLEAVEKNGRIKD
ncbi:MAG: hypothetical protein H7301_12355 [Cryobacterium sp.]|nr:hypothetical protein [Oligoflexia bacterium]